MTTQKILLNLISIVGSVITVYFLSALSAHAEGFAPLTNIPGIDVENASIGDYFNGLYIVIIGVAALIAVVKIAVSGTQYMLSDVVASKETAKKGLQGAVLGLVIILATHIVLSTIYDDLIRFDFLREYDTTPVTPIPNLAPDKRTFPCITGKSGYDAEYQGCISFCDSLPGSTYEVQPGPGERFGICTYGATVETWRKGDTFDRCWGNFAKCKQSCVRGGGCPVPRENYVDCFPNDSLPFLTSCEEYDPPLTGLSDDGFIGSIGSGPPGDFNITLLDNGTPHGLVFDGIYITDASGNTILGQTGTTRDDGIYLAGKGEQVTFSSESCSGCTLNLVLDGREGHSNAEYPRLVIPELGVDMDIRAEGYSKGGDRTIQIPIP